MPAAAQANTSLAFSRIPTAKIRMRAQIFRSATIRSESPGDGASIKAVIEDLERRHPGMRERLLDEKGEIRRFVNIYLNGNDVRFLEAINSKVKDGDDISIVPAIAGGR